MRALDEIRERLEAATPGPWKTVRDDLTLYVEAESGELNPISLGYVGNRPENDGEFIAHAPEDMARLIDAVESSVRVLDERAAQLRETSDRLNREVIARDPRRDPDAAERYAHYAAQAEVAANALRNTITAALEAKP